MSKSVELWTDVREVIYKNGKEQRAERRTVWSGIHFFERLRFEEPKFDSDEAIWQVIIDELGFSLR